MEINLTPEQISQIEENIKSISLSPEWTIENYLITLGTLKPSFHIDGEKDENGIHHQVGWHFELRK